MTQQEARSPAQLITRVAQSPDGADLVDEAALEGLAQVSGTPVRRALEALLLTPDPQPGLGRLQRAGVLRAVLPELDATVDLAAEGDRRHKDVWAHTALVVAQSPVRLPVRWAALLHDIGKVRTRAFTADGRVTFLGHPEEGAALFSNRIAPRLAFPRDLAGTVGQLIVHHQRPSQYSAQWQDSAVRRLSRDMGELLPGLLDLSRADVTSRIPGRRAEALRLIDELAGRVETLRLADARVPPLPPGLGDAIMERFGLAPGPHIGRLRRALEQAVEEGTLAPHQSADHYLDHLAQTGLSEE